MKKILSKKGFTLIELIVVIAILAILAAILVPSITGYISEATKAKDAANARTVYTEYAMALALDQTYTFPSGCSATTLNDFKCEFGDFAYSAPDFTAVPK